MRANPKDINKLQLEGLVKAGAFVLLEKNRNLLFNSIPKLIQINKGLWEESKANKIAFFLLSQMKKN